MSIALRYDPVDCDESAELLRIARQSAHIACRCLGQAIQALASSTWRRVCDTVERTLMSRTTAWTLAGGGWGVSIGFVAMLAWR